MVSMSEKCNEGQSTANASKGRIYSLDFVRGLAALSILLYHLAYAVDKPLFPKEYANGNMDSFLVFLFIMLSGAVLYLRYKDIGNLKEFYYKRWKSIFPLYLAFFIVLYVYTAVKSGSAFYSEPAGAMLFSLTAFDGYLAWSNSFLSNTVQGLFGLTSGQVAGYYEIGEWFLGLILILYALYPIILFAFKKYPVITLVTAIVLYILEAVFTDYNITRTVIHGVLGFIIGMFIMKYFDKVCNNKLILLGSLVICAIILFVKLPSTEFYVPIVSLTFFILLNFVGVKLTENSEKMVKISTWLGTISFAIFLVQRKSINLTVKLFGSDIPYWAAALFSIAVALVVSDIGVRVMNYLLRSKYYVHFEQYLYKKVLGPSSKNDAKS